VSWHNLWHGTWTQNRLLQRKWLLTAAVVAAAVVLDIVGRALAETTAHLLEILVPAYLAVEGALDWRNRRGKDKEKETEL